MLWQETGVGRAVMNVNFQRMSKKLRREERNEEVNGGSHFAQPRARRPHHARAGGGLSMTKGELGEAEGGVWRRDVGSACPAGSHVCRAASGVTLLATKSETSFLTTLTRRK